MWVGISATELVVSYIEDNGPQSVKALQEAHPQLPVKRIKNGIDRAVNLGLLHSAGHTPRKAGVYLLGPRPGWMPNPMPPASVWDYAAKCEAKAKPAGYEIPVFGK
jgi:hypothetical protein